MHGHGALEELAPRLWRVEGGLPTLPIPRNMIVYRREDGGLVIWSGVCLDEAGMRELDALGPVRQIVVPNRFHRMQARAYLERYPEARVLCPAACRDHVEKEVTVHGTVEDELPGSGVTLHLDAGIKPFEPVYEFALDDGVALVFCDAIFNVTRRAGLKGWFVHHVLKASGRFATSRIGRWFILASRPRFREFLLEQSARPDLRVVGVAHGEPITADCGTRLAQAAAYV